MRTGGWRRAFCTSVQEDSEGTAPPLPPPPATKREEGEQQKRAPSPRNSAKLSFFSGSGGNPSTPRLAAAASGVGCRTRSKSPGSQRLQCETPLAVAPESSSSAPDASAAGPPSPRSPSKFAFFKHHSRSRCPICSQSLKPSQDAAVFTAECSHDFHFPCIAAHVKSRSGLACPVCSAAWSQIPFIPPVHPQEEAAATAAAVKQRIAGEMENRNPNRRTASGIGIAAKVYDDDEPLLLVSNTNHGGALRFNPIPEVADEDKDDDDENDEYGDENVEELAREDELRGLLANSASRCRSCEADAGTSHGPPTSSRSGGIQLSVMPQAALISEGRRHRNYVVALKVKATPMRPDHLLGRASGRAPIDLVMVLDVSGGMTGEKPQMLKRSMRLVISSLGPADRLSMVAFSAAAGAKRLLPLRQMSRDGQRAARQIVERLVMVGVVAAAAAAATGRATVGDALRKATRVLEDRRERNPIATVMLLSNATKQQEEDEGERKDDDDVNQRHHHRPICSPRDSGDGAPTTRFAHLEIPVFAPALGEAEPSPKYGQVPSEDAFITCVGGLVSMVFQDVHLQLVFPSGEISTVYPSAGGCVGSCKDVELRGGCCVLRLGYLCAEEERELLVELRVPSSSSSLPPAISASGCKHHLSVKYNYKDPASQAVTFGEEQLLLLPPLLPQHAEPSRASPSSSAGSATSLRLRNLFVSTRAVAESRRLAELSDHATAHSLLSSARALLLHSNDCDAADRHLVQSLDAELADLQRRQRHPHPDESTQASSGRNRRRRAEHQTSAAAEARGDPLTPTSAWRAAEQLAKVAIMRKSLNRVGDLHGLENARF